MATSPVKDSAGVVTVTVYVDGNALDSLFALESVWIRKEVNRIGQATLVFMAGDIGRRTIEESESDSLTPGKVIRIEAGYVSDEAVLFKGIVVTHEVEIAEGESPRLVVECRDQAFPATLSRKNRLFTQKKDSEALTTIWGDYSVTATINASTIVYPELVQYYCSDWDFTLIRADLNGWVVVTEQDDITIGPPVLDGTAVVGLTYGIDLIEFKGTLQADTQVSDVTAWAWDPSQQKVISKDAVAPALNDQGSDEPATWAEDLGVDAYGVQTCMADEDMLQSWANGIRLKTGLNRISGQFRFQGNAGVVPGCIVELSGVGERFNGSVYVGSVEHEIKDGNWYTTAGMGINARNASDYTDVMSPAASGILPGIHGLHIGKVTKLEDDPQNEYRIQVDFPLLNGQTNTVWARMMHPWAGSGAGFYFLPDENDEVILGFFNDDPCHPVILGCLYSSKRKPPYTYENANNTRAFLSRSKIRIELDEKDKVVTIATPSKNKIVLDDKGKSILLQDEHGNKIRMEKAGVTIDSSKDITLKAAANIKIQSGTNTTIKATSNVKVDGVKVEASASSTFKAQGSLSAELSASGQTVVKGALVKIN